ncbi:cell division cycle protein 20 homolog, putative [Plasmodium chabaudi chabaudi]|uniref:Cell division cycle protein 20 homolog, putative n=1 Tax=Plasmodium chabaudi chabaudi TaxID=31271 RepID=A0A4V6M916_PLACU|nr:cell division cycle protein 20 homolog, putative [Plasmodium chabaudi chabaudi]VTZ67444.1 cell division cycle protein 20 homolog, putative [Plasmodium chabaudi chabaudi]|eukprot:XP_016655184.1 cell division cycle protein 20 homolog, putative [Plasmodium chabaudi chabaudi]
MIDDLINEGNVGNSLFANLFKEKKNKETPMPNQNLGTFSVSNRDLYKDIFKHNIVDEYESDIEDQNLHFNYIYKTRYSRENENNIKIDEYTLKRATILNGKNDNNWDSSLFRNLNNFDYIKKRRGRKNMGLKKSGIMGSQKNSLNSNYLNNNSHCEENMFIENEWKYIYNNENNKNRCIDNLITSYSFTYPSHIFYNDKSEKRKIFSKPYKVLSAPKLADNFYLNLLDWSKRNIIAVGLNEKLYMWNCYTCKKHELFDLSILNKKKKKKKNDTQKYIASLKWNIFGNYLAVGLSNGVVEIWDIEKGSKIRKYKNHKLRVGSLCWYYNILTTGSRDNTIINCDIRTKDSNYIKYEKHTSEVCGLQWNYNGKLLASGSNDNSIYIWDNNKNDFIFHFTKHKAAVKAISWCPHDHNLLTTGGGSADKKIYFWDINNGECINSINTKSQVSNILWSKNTKELISTHSYTHSQIIIWNYPDLNKISALTDHKLRVLYAALSPDGTSLVSGSPDETIRLWNVFPKINDHNLPLLFPFENYYEIIR